MEKLAFKFDRPYFSFFKSAALAFHAMKHNFGEFCYYFFPISVSVALLTKIKFLQFFFSCIFITFLWYFFKSFFFPDKFEDILEKIEKNRKVSELELMNRTSFFSQIWNFFKGFFRRTNPKHMRAQPFVSMIPDKQKINKSEQNSNKITGLKHLPKKLNIFKKIWNYLIENLKPKTPPRTTLSNPYLKRVINQTIKEEKLKRTKTPNGTTSPLKSPKGEIYRITKKHSSIVEPLRDRQAILLKKRVSLNSRSSTLLIKKASFSRTNVSFDVASSQKQSQPQLQKKRLHLSRSLSLKHAKEKQVPFILLEKNNLLTNEAEKCFEELKISREMGGWIARCKSWVIDEMVRKIFAKNVENLVETNKILEGHYRKTLQEFQLLYGEIRKSNVNFEEYQFVSLNDLMNSQAFLKVYSSDIRSDILKLDEHLGNLIKERQCLDICLAVPGYEISQIRTHILEKFLRFLEGMEMFEYSEGERKDIRLPSDTQTLAHIFSNYLFYEIFENDYQYFYSFLLSPHDKIIGKKENCFFPFDLFLQQINPSIYEPHYQVVFKDEIWKTLPGNENIYCAIVLFFLALTREMKGNLKNYSKLYKIISYIFG